jgi:hypothetical protein
MRKRERGRKLSRTPLTSVGHTWNAGLCYRVDSTVANRRCSGGRDMSAMTLKLVRVVGTPILAALVTSTAIAGPLNLADPTSRQIRVEVDQELHDYAAIGGAYSLPIPASFASDGTTATITVDGSAAAAFVDDFFNGAVGTVPGSFSDYVVTIDVASGAVTSAHVSGTLDTVLGPVSFDQTASSDAIAGFTIFPFMGFDFPLFCDTGEGCTIVPGAPYDAATGRANAVGIIVTSVFNTFTPFGDIRLTEDDGLRCDTAVNAKDFVAPETVEVGVDFRNGSATGRAVEVKVWIARADGFLVSAINVGADGQSSLPGGSEDLYPQSPLFTVNASTILGDWEVGCRLLDPITGETLAEDHDAFEVLAARASASGAFLD